MPIWRCIAPRKTAKRFSLLHPSKQNAIGGASCLRGQVAPGARSRGTVAALSTEGGRGDRKGHRSRSAAPVDIAGSGSPAADAVHSARRRDRYDRADRALGVEAGLRAKYGLAQARVSADVDGGQPFSASILG